jgi:hypothetical protein
MNIKITENSSNVNISEGNVTNLSLSTGFFLRYLKQLLDVDSNLSPIDNSILKYNAANSQWEIGSGIAPIDSVNGKTGTVVLDSDDITEGSTNKYYSSSLFDTDFSGKTTTDLTEGTNLYYTDARVSTNSDVSANISARHDAVTLSGTPNYLTLTGQDIALGLIDLTTDVTGVLPNANVATDITLDNITQITNRSHTNLSDIGTNTHSQIDSHIADTSTNPHSVTKSDVGLGNVANVDTTNASNISSGTLSSSVLPPIAITDTYTAVDETEQLALTVQKGDVCVRTDENKSYINSTGNNTAMSDWQELQTPTDSVLSVNGQTGTVILSTSDLTEDADHNYVTDAEKTVIGNTSGTNTGDQVSSDFTHNNLSGLDLGDYQHLTSTQKTDLTDAGDSALHYHSSDRDRTNHTGTQTASTISDFDTEVSNNTDVSNNTSFRTTPSTVITAGTNLSWSGNTLNAAGASVASIDDIGDVTITTVADNELLAYDSTSGEWINQTPNESGFAAIATSGNISDAGDYDANKYIDHTGVSITAGTGLTGGGDISSTRTLNVDVGIADDKIVQMDDLDAADNDYAKFTTNGLEGRSYSEVKSDLSLDNVENTALSTWAGSTNLTTLGTIGTGTWQGNDIAVGYIDGSSGTNGQVLTSDGTNASWQDASGGSSDSVNVETLTANKTLVAGTDDTVQYLDPNGANRTVTLSTSGATNGDKFTIINTATNGVPNYLTIILDTTTVGKIYGQARIQYVYDGSSWLPTTTGSFDNSTDDNVICIGNSAKGLGSSISIGKGSVGSNSSVGIGYSAIAENQSIAIGGFTDADSQSIAIGHYANTNSQKYSVAMGYYIKCERYCEFTKNIKPLSNRHNWSVIGLYGSTTDATETEIFCAGVSNQRVNILADSALGFKAMITAKDSDGTDCKYWEVSGLIKRDGASNTSIVGTVTKTVIAEETGASSWDCDFTADDTNEALKVTVTGASATNIDWTVRVDTSETRN